jgi:hypothetical protein
MNKTQMLVTTIWIRSLRFGIAAGALIAAGVTVIMVVWEWLENPGGIFRGESGTNWGFVLDTATSWFIPTFIYAAVVAFVACLVWLSVRRRFHKD